MKKIILLLALVSAVFVSCSDDNSDDFPIEGLKLPESETPWEIGSQITIEGAGFTTASEIWLSAITVRSTENAKVKAEIHSVSSSSITFIAPKVYGQQNIILNEGGKEYVLGTLTFKAEVKILPQKIKKVIFSEDEDHSIVYEYTYENGKIKSYKRTSGGRMTNAVYTYSSDKIIMESDDEKETYSLENNRVKLYKSIYLENNVYDEYEFTYNGDYLSQIESVIESNGSQTENLSFAAGKLLSYTYADKNNKNEHGSIDCTYKEQLNNLNIDLFYFVGYYFNSGFQEVFLLGIGGNRSQYLPEEMKINEPVYDEENDEPLAQQKSYRLKFKYEMQGEYITKIITSDQDNKIDIMVEILYEE